MVASLDIRIVPPDLAAAADARLAGTRDVFARGPHGRLLSHQSRRDLVSPYLLAGTAYCVACGGALISQTQGTHNSGRRRHVYSCVCHQKRGVTICTNSVRVPHVIMDRAVLTSLSEAFDARMIEEAIEQGWRSSGPATTRPATAGRRWSGTSRRSSKSATWATRSSAATDELLAMLEAEGDLKKAIARELAGLGAAAKLASLDSARLAKRLRAGAADVKALLGASVPQAREMLRKLLVGRLPCEGFRDTRGRGYRFAGTGTYARFLTGEALVTRGATLRD